MAKKRADGEGTVRKRSDGRWEGIVTIGKNTAGKPITKSVFAKTQKELMPRLHTLIQQYRGVVLNEDSGMTLSAWLDRWFAEYAEPTLRPDTVAGYHRYARKICKFLGDKPIRQITTPDVQRMYNKLKRSGRECDGTELADSYVRSIHMVFHEAMDAAVCAKRIAKNPTNGTTIPKNNYKDMTVLNDEQLNIFMEAIKNEMQENAAAKIDQGIGGCKTQNGHFLKDEKSGQPSTPKTRFEPYKGKVRKPGTGCLYQINDHLWEGSYSPTHADGKRKKHTVYAKTKDECEKRLANLIEEVKADIQAEKEQFALRM